MQCYHGAIELVPLLGESEREQGGREGGGERNLNSASNAFCQFVQRAFAPEWMSLACSLPQEADLCLLHLVSFANKLLVRFAGGQMEEGKGGQSISFHFLLWSLSSGSQCLSGSWLCQPPHQLPPTPSTEHTVSSPLSLIKPQAQ